jgi:hypothetical protein
MATSNMHPTISKIAMEKKWEHKKKKLIMAAHSNTEPK